MLISCLLFISDILKTKFCQSIISFINTFGKTGIRVSLNLYFLMRAREMSRISFGLTGESVK